MNYRYWEMVEIQYNHHKFEKLNGGKAGKR
jgi:hypothetical protein